MAERFIETKIVVTGAEAYAAQVAMIRTALERLNAELEKTSAALRELDALFAKAPDSAEQD